MCTLLPALASAALLLAAPLDAESDAFAAAYALKKASRSAEAAAAFEAIARDHPTSPRVGEALVEAGIGWFTQGRGLQVLHRSPTASVQAFDKAVELFARVVVERPADPSAGRAQYMQGSTRQFQGDLAAAEDAYSVVIASYASDRKYLGKALERRASVRRQLLMPGLAIEDLRRHQKEFGKTGEEAAVVERYLQFAAMFEKPAPPLDVEAWIQGGPTTLDAMRGSVIGLYFFATWCEQCAKELPFVLDLEQRYGASGFELVGVFDRSRGQTVESVRKFLKESRIPFPALMDRGRTTAAHQGRNIPDLVLIDKLGRVRWHDHPANLADWTIEALIGESTAPTTPPKPR